jgi:hypothetical protein
MVLGGRITAINGQWLTVDFGTFGIKQLTLRSVPENGVNLQHER